MNLPQFSVKRPVFTTMVTLILVILGGVSLSRLRIDMLPNIEMPTLSIRTEYEGASPEVIERLVTRIIEEIVATVPGVEEIHSTSSQGRSDVRVSFVWGTQIDTAAIDVQSKIEDEINELPEDIVRPRVRKFDIASFPVVVLGISSRLDPVELTELIEDQLRYRFARIPGVAQVDVWGGFNREVRIELDPERLKAVGLPLERVLQAIRDANLDLPAGKIEEGPYEVTLRAPAEFVNLDQIRNTVLAQRDGSGIRLGQIAEVIDTYEKLTRIVRVNGERGLRVAIRKQANANTVEVAQRILAEIEAANRAYPQIQVVPVTNQGSYIERAITNVAQSIAYGGGLAVLVLLFFLRSIPSTLVIALAIPISVITTFALVFFGGLTLNLMTLGGLALGVGMMVDSAIVVLENIFRRRKENDESPQIAAVQGAWEVGPAITASTITTLVIFLPLIFVRGVSGILFKELAYVIIFALICSLLVALSLVPMLASKLLAAGPHIARHPGAAIHRWSATAAEIYDRIERVYLAWLRRAVGHRRTTLLIAVGLLGFSLALLPFIGSEFQPPSDEGEVRITGKMEVGTRLALVDQQTRLMEQIVTPAVPEAVSAVVTAGSAGWRAGAPVGDMTLALIPASRRERSNEEIAQALRPLLAGRVPGMEIRVRAPQGQYILERILGGDQGLTVEIRGYDLATLDLLAAGAARAMQVVRGITDLETSLEAGIPQHEIHVNRDKVADLGLSVRDVTQLLQTAVAGATAGEYRTGGNSYRILVQLKDAEKRSLDEILNLTLTTASGEKVALRNVVSAQAGRGPILIDRKDQQRRVTVKANVSGRDQGSVAAEVQALLDRMPRPAGYDLSVGGNFEEQQKAFGELIVSLGLALVLVYMVMACQYESLRDPLVVMFSVPLAVIGVLVTLFATGTTLNLQSYIGCIMLGGIVVNNAILLVDQAGRLVREGWSTRDAVIEAGRRRLRPILMTTLTTLLGLLPLALGIGEGADAQAPLARAVVGGLASSTLITLVLIPVIYTFFHPDPKREA
jgi:HAE1 family hydrophobic/amphiphilic exporter-1